MAGPIVFATLHRLPHVRHGNGNRRFNLGAVIHQFAVVVGIQRNPDLMLSRRQWINVVLRLEYPSQLDAVHVDVGMPGARRMRLIHRVRRELETFAMAMLHVHASLSVRFRCDRHADWCFGYDGHAEGDCGWRHHRDTWKVDAECSRRRRFEGTNSPGMVRGHFGGQIVTMQVYLSRLIGRESRSA